MTDAEEQLEQVRARIAAAPTVREMQDLADRVIAETNATVNAKVAEAVSNLRQVEELLRELADALSGGGSGGGDGE